MNQPLTPEEEQYILDWVEANPMPDQDENGVDLGRLRENLKLTPAERLDRLERHMKSVAQLRQAFQKSQVQQNHG